MSTSVSRAGSSRHARALVLASTLLLLFLSTCQRANAQQTLWGAVGLGDRTFMSVRHDGGDGVGYSDDGFTTLGLFTGQPLTPVEVLVLDNRISMTNEGRAVGNFGGGLRHYVEGINRFFGLHARWGFDDAHESSFGQMGFTAETAGQDWNALMNLYVPTGNRHKIVESMVGGAGAGGGGMPFFQGNNLVTDSSITIFQRTLVHHVGGDAEFGVPITFHGEDYGVRAFGGFYHYQVSGSEQIYGPRVRVEADLTRSAHGQVLVTNDRVFGTSVVGMLAWTFGGRNRGGPPTVYNRMWNPVEYSQRAVVGEQIIEDFIDAVVVLTDGGNPITITHIDNNAAGANSGTFEDPFTSLTAAAGAGTNIVYVHADSSFAAEGYALAPNQRFLGEGGGNQHMVNTDQLGMIVLPAGNGGASRPTIQNAGGTAITANNNTEISNFAVSNSTTGVLLNGLTGNVDVNRSTISAATGIDIMGGSGLFSFSSVAVSGTTTAGLSINGGSSTVTFDAMSSITNAAGASVNVAGGHSGMLTFASGSTISATGGTGLQFNDADGTYAFNGTATLNGGDAGIDILGNSNGTFTFGTGTSITNPSGTAFNVNGDGTNSPSIVYSGTIANNAGDVIAIQNTVGANTITFNSGVADAITDSGTGVFLNNVAQNVNFTADMELTGTEGIDIDGGSGTFTFADTDVANTSAAAALDINGGSSVVNFQANSSITQNQNQAAVNVTGGHTGMLTYAGTLSATNGTGLQFNNADGTYNFTNAFTLNGGDAGIDIINGSGGAFTFSSASSSITNPTGHAFNVEGATGNISYAGSITNNSNYSVRVVNSGGTAGGGNTIAFSGPIDDNGGLGVLLDNNDQNNGATINFTGGMTLDTGANNAFTATNGGTVNVTGTNTIGGAGAISGVGVTITDTTLGTSGVTFQSISVNGAANGIVLSNTGSTGFFTVTGDGSMSNKLLPDGTMEMVLDRDGSGGTITGTTGHSVSLNNAFNVTLNQMNITNSGADAINSTGGGDFTFAALLVDNPTGYGWRATNLTGTNYVNNDSLFEDVDNANTSAIRVTNTNTNLTLLEIENSTFQNNDSGQSVVFVEQAGTSMMNFDVFGSTFTGNFAQAVTAAAGQTAGSTGELRTRIGGPNAGDGNLFKDASTAGNGGENNVGILLANGATHRALVQGNTFDNVGLDGSIANTSIIRLQNNGGTFIGEVRDNTIENIQSQFGGGRHGIGYIAEPAGMELTTTSLIIDGNHIDELLDTGGNPSREAIFIDLREGSDDADITISNNVIGQKSGSVGQVGGGQEAIDLRFRGTNSKTVNLLITGNTVTGTSSQALVEIDAEDNVTLNATVTNNTFNNLGTGDEFDMDTEDAGVTACLNLSGHTTGTFNLNETAGTFTATDLANIGTNNSGATVNVGAGITDAGGACPTPTHPTLFP